MRVLWPHRREKQRKSQSVWRPKVWAFSQGVVLFSKKLGLTLCDPMDCSTPDLPSPHYLPKLAQVHVHWIMMLSKCLILSASSLFASIFPADSSVGKESTCHAGDPGSIPGSGRSAGEGIGYPLQYCWASLVAQLVKNLPAIWETGVCSLGWEDPLEKGKATHSSILAWRILWPGGFHGVTKSRTWLSNSHSLSQHQGLFPWVSCLQQMAKVFLKIPQLQGMVEGPSGVSSL